MFELGTHLRELLEDVLDFFTFEHVKKTRGISRRLSISLFIQKAIGVTEDHALLVPDEGEIVLGVQLDLSFEDQIESFSDVSHPVNGVVLIILHLLSYLDDGPHELVVFRLSQYLDGFDKAAKLGVKNVFFERIGQI